MGLTREIVQPPLNTTLIGVLRGVSDYFGLGYSDAMLFGGTGHAFLINVHEELCPSGPYCWNRSTFTRLAANLGITIHEHGFYHKDASPDARAEIESLLRAKLDAGIPCSLLNLENQLITGYDETGFLTAQPWPAMDFPPKHLTFGSWQELGDSVHMVFFSFEKCEPASADRAIAQSLDYAVELLRHPERFSGGGYGAGPNGYANWINAIKNGHGGSHGSWWNGMVWAECRRHAAAYFGEIPVRYGETAETSRHIGAEYGAIAEALQQASVKDLAAEPKIELLKCAAEREAACAEPMEALARQLRAA